MNAFEELSDRNPLLVAVHGRCRVGVENHGSETVFDDTARMEIARSPCRGERSWV